MVDTVASIDTRLVVKKKFSATRDKVFDAWTNPVHLQKWWHSADNWTSADTEVNLKVGGMYRLGMHDPEKNQTYVVAGYFKEIVQNEKLVYTWKWEGHEASKETLVTVLFHDLGDSTELELIHERFPDKNMRDQHAMGWEGCMSQLAKLF